jgi:tight adherence protein B
VSRPVRAGLRLTFVAAALAALVLPAAALAQPADQTVHIRGVDEHGFPTVALTLSVGGAGTLSAQDVAIAENGVPVRLISLQPLEQTGRKIDVVLAIDTSKSVAGEPLATAVAAAKTFIEQLPSGVPVGIVTFARTPRVTQPITANHSEALFSLSSLTTHGGTALYDAVSLAAGLFTGPAQHNLIVLTDGSDTVSQATLQSAVATAKGDGVTVFSVGLGDHVDQDVLQTLATQTGGTYSPATEASVTDIYRRLSGELSHQYVVTYRSPSRAGAQVSIAVTVAGASDTALALTPIAAPATGSGSRLPTLTGTVGLAVVLVLTFLTVFLLFIMILGANLRASRQRELTRRMLVMEGHPHQAAAPQRPDTGLAAWIPEPLVQAAERVAAAGGFSGTLEQKLEQAGLSLRVGELVAATILAGMVGVVLGGLILQSWLFALVFGVAAATIPAVLLSMAINRRTSRLQGQLADVVNILASSLRAGHSFFQAIDMVSKEIGEPAGPELQRVVAEIRLGRPVDQALNAMAERVGSDDFQWAVLAVNIQREVGGNLAEILDTVAETVRERGTLRRQMRVLSAEGRLSLKILAALPFLIGLYVAKVNPGYIDLLFSTRLGWIMLGTGAALMVAGIFWARKIVKIDV